jgi:hypothetical protein
MGRPARQYCLQAPRRSSSDPSSRWPSRAARQRLQPRRPRQRGCDGGASAYSAAVEGFRPPQTGRLSAPTPRRFVSRCKLRPLLGGRPCGSDPMQSGAALCLSAVAGSAALLTPHRKRSQRASWVLSNLALLPGAGRLHVNVKMAPSTSRRCKRRAYCIGQLRGPGDSSAGGAPSLSAVRANEKLRSGSQQHALSSARMALAGGRKRGLSLRPGVRRLDWPKQSLPTGPALCPPSAFDFLVRGAAIARSGPQEKPRPSPLRSRKPRVSAAIRDPYPSELASCSCVAAVKTPALRANALRPGTQVERARVDATSASVHSLTGLSQSGFEAQQCFPASVGPSVGPRVRACFRPPEQSRRRLRRRPEGACGTSGEMCSEAEPWHPLPV